MQFQVYLSRRTELISKHYNFINNIIHNYKLYYNNIYTHTGTIINYTICLLYIEIKIITMKFFRMDQNHCDFLIMDHQE